MNKIYTLFLTIRITTYHVTTKDGTMLVLLKNVSWQKNKKINEQYPIDLNLANKSNMTHFICFLPFHVLLTWTCMFKAKSNEIIKIIAYYHLLELYCTFFAFIRNIHTQTHVSNRMHPKNILIWAKYLFIHVMCKKNVDVK